MEVKNVVSVAPSGTPDSVNSKITVTYREIPATIQHVA